MIKKVAVVRDDDLKRVLWAGPAVAARDEGGTAEVVVPAAAVAAAMAVTLATEVELLTK
ncbi:hypothetical protein J5X84_39820 [Streptosporangiaceae bacterium NEAU-GS5]|nr:hypothetical protein [Streptosporangiaceae bacterium NEAU-GS5]